MNELPSLLTTRQEASDMINKQITEGASIKEIKISSENDYEQVKNKIKNWHLYNIELLKRIFDNNFYADEYWKDTGRGGGFLIHTNLRLKIDYLNKNVDKGTYKLQSIIERMGLIPELIESSTPNSDSGNIEEVGSDVFIVHGHDEAAKEKVARFIEKLELNVIILHEKPNAGRTLIQKFEDFSNVGFSVIIITSDDVGAPKVQREKIKFRARQNVIFELGYFLGKLGRNKVCVLYEENVELPSDYEGVVYIPLDDNGAWKILLAREIKTAGIDVDLNMVIE